MTTVLALMIITTTSGFEMDHRLMRSGDCRSTATRVVLARKAGGTVNVNEYFGNLIVAVSDGGDGMSLASGRYWITPTQRAAMATALGKQYRVSDGKITKKPARMAAGQLKNAHGKASRLAKRWASKSKGKRS
jgi:hypothetical protein